MKLTNTKAKSLPAPTDKGQVFHWDSETRGFGLRITSAGAKSWIAQGRVNGKTRRYTLGPFELLSADDARKRAQAKLLEMYDGKDPQVEKKGYTDLMVDGAPSPHQSDTTLRWLIDRLRS